MSLNLDLHLLYDLLREEWRLHKSLSGILGSSLFPLLIFIFSIIIRILSPPFGSSTGLLLLHVSAIIYGVFVGGFGSLGESIMTRRLGQVSILLQLPRIQPISLRRVMGLFYIKDAFFYLVYTFIPLVLGWGVASHFVFEWVLGASLFIVFLIGMGVSFAFSASPRLLKATIVLTLGILVILSYPIGWVETYFLLPPLGFWIDGQLSWFAIGLAAALLSAFSGIMLMRDRYDVNENRYIESFQELDRRFNFVGSIGSLVAKEWIELIRSRSLGAAVGGYALHLIVLYAITWVLQGGFGVPLGFNLVFYGGFVGFMGVLTYSFLTSIEQNDYLDVLPVTVDMLVKAKILIYFIVTSGIGFGFVVLIGILRGELELIPGGLAVAACMSTYVVVVTAYLTGLWTNTMFFGAATMSKFSLLVVPPMMVVEVGALILPISEFTGILLLTCISVASLLASLLLLKRLPDRWRRRSFSIS